MSKHNSIFDYVNIDTGGRFKISPSQISKFFDYPTIWYKEQILGESEFNGNTATTLGTIIHAFAESFANGNPISRDDVEEYFEHLKKTRGVGGDPINFNEIRELYPDMASLLINEYVRHNMPDSTEDQLLAPITDDVVVAGSCDNRTNSIVVDYKNVSTKPNTNAIPFGYKIQLLAYAYMYRHSGQDIDRIRLVYTVRPTKTLPVRTFTVTEVVKAEDWEMIENTLKLIAESVEKIKTNPELTHLIFKSYKLKGN